MTQPIVFEIPHRLGTVEAKRRVQGNLGDLERSIPGATRVTSTWQGDRLDIAIQAFGQDLSARLDVEPSRVAVHLALPGLLGLIGERIARYFRTRTTALLEDKR